MAKRSSPKQHTAQQPQAAAVVQAAAPAAQVQPAPPVVMLLTPAAPAPEPLQPAPSPLTEEDCAAFMGVLPKPPKAPEPPSEPPRLTTEQRENPRYLSGEALRELAHRWGIARSEAAAMSDDKLRMQLRYIVAHHGETEAA